MKITNIVAVGTASGGNGVGPIASGSNIYVASTASASAQAEVVAAINAAFAAVGQTFCAAVISFEGDSLPPRGQALQTSSDVYVVS